MLTPLELQTHLSVLGFLATELRKAGIEPRPAGNVEAPDPQKMIDLEVGPSSPEGWGDL